MILTGDLHASPEELQFLRPEYLKEKYAADAYLENDANACAVAEWK